MRQLTAMSAELQKAAVMRLQHIVETAEGGAEDEERGDPWPPLASVLLPLAGVLLTSMPSRSPAAFGVMQWPAEPVRVIATCPDVAWEPSPSPSSSQERATSTSQSAASRNDSASSARHRLRYRGLRKWRLRALDL